MPNVIGSMLNVIGSMLNVILAPASPMQNKSAQSGIKRLQINAKRPNNAENIEIITRIKQKHPKNTKKRAKSPENNKKDIIKSRHDGDNFS